MKSKQEILSALLSRLAELKDGRIKQTNPAMAERLKIELALLYFILDEEDIDEEYWEQIEAQI